MAWLTFRVIFSVIPYTGLDATGFPTRSCSNKPAQLQRLARIVNFHLEQVLISYFPMSELQSRLSDCVDAHPRRLVGAFVVCKPPKTGFLAQRPILFHCSLAGLVY